MMLEQITLLNLDTLMTCSGHTLLNMEAMEQFKEGVAIMTRDEKDKYIEPLFSLQKCKNSLEDDLKMAKKNVVNPT